MNNIIKEMNTFFKSRRMLANFYYSIYPHVEYPYSYKERLTVVFGFEIDSEDDSQYEKMKEVFPYSVQESFENELELKYEIDIYFDYKSLERSQLKDTVEISFISRETLPIISNNI